MSNIEMSKLQAAAARLVKAGLSTVRAADEITNAYALSRFERDEILRAISDRRMSSFRRTKFKSKMFL